MLYLTRIRTWKRDEQVYRWLRNPYAVHQSLMEMCDGDPRLLFRIEPDRRTIVAQSHTEPDCARLGFPLKCEYKSFDPHLIDGLRYRFRLLGNPTVRRAGRRLGLRDPDEQLAWLQRKLSGSGAELLGCIVSKRRAQYSFKPGCRMTHLAVQYDGELATVNAGQLKHALAWGIGPAKGLGFGLLSLARA